MKECFWHAGCILTILSSLKGKDQSEIEKLVAWSTEHYEEKLKKTLSFRNTETFGWNLSY